MNKIISIAVIIYMLANWNVKAQTYELHNSVNFNNVDDGRNTPDGITWYKPAPLEYGIYRTNGSWIAPNYQQLKMSWETGIIINGGNLYGKSGTILQPGGGNVGIGTITPYSKLHVNGNTYVSNASIGRSGGHYDEFGYNIGFTGTNDQYTYRVNDFAASIRMGWNGAIEFRTAPSGTEGTTLSLAERMRITLDGNVGIGTTSPNNKLQIGSNTYYSGNDFVICNSNGALAVHNDASDTYLYGTNDISIRPGNGAIALYAKSNGNVLIGKTSQTATGTRYKLDVEGPIRAHEIVVNTTGADFVFGPTYKLRALSELETFIRTNKHLPDIAPAKEMQKNGVSAGEMQTKLLQKVEELTLYVIEKDKEIAVLKAEKTKQNAVNEELRLLLFEMSTRLEKLEKNSNK